MKYSIRKITSVEQWDKFLFQINPWCFFQSARWISLQKQIGIPVYQLGIFEGQTLVGISAVFVVRAKRGTFLHVRHGPILSNYQDILLWNFFLKELKILAHKEHAWFIRVSPLIEENETHKILFQKLHMHPSPIHQMDGEICWVLDIDKTESELLSGMRKTTRYLIRQSQKLGVQIKQENDLTKFFNLYQLTSRRHGFAQHKGIAEEFELFARTNQAILLQAYFDNKVLSSAIILFFGEEAIYHHSASIESKIPASYLLQWHAVLEAKKRGKKYYNFWGIASSEQPNHPWKGITLFKQGFGGRELRFIHAHDLPLSPFYGISYTIEMVRKLRRGY